MRKSHLFLVSLVLTSLFLPACIPGAPDCKQEDIFCAALVTNLNPINDKAFNQAAWEGLQQAKSEGIADWVKYIESTDGRDYSKNIKTFANLGYDVIFTIGESMSESTATAAEQYPEQYFFGIDQYQDWSIDTDSSNDLNNLTGLVFPEDQAGFLAGALAALMTETNRVGAVCASDFFPHVWRYGEGFRAGAVYIDPDLEIQVLYHDDVSADQSFNDPEWGASTTAMLIDTGADVIFGVGGETAQSVLTESATRGVYVIGADSDQYLLEPVAAPKLLSSAMKSITSAVIENLLVTRAAQKGNAAFPAGNTFGEVKLAPFHDLDGVVPDEVKVRLEELALMLQNGILLTGVPAEKP